MQNVVYVGSSDHRELAGEDFEKMGINHKDESFARGQVVEVSNEAAKVLLADDSLVSGEFQSEEDFNKAESEREVKRAWSMVPDTSAILANPGDEVIEPESVNENRVEETGIGGQQDAQTEGSSDATASGGTTGSSKASGAKSTSGARSTSGSKGASAKASN
jgi:hypothetical protein